MPGSYILERARRGRRKGEEREREKRGREGQKRSGKVKTLMCFRAHRANYFHSPIILFGLRISSSRRHQDHRHYQHQERAQAGEELKLQAQVIALDQFVPAILEEEEKEKTYTPI